MGTTTPDQPPAETGRQAAAAWARANPIPVAVAALTVLAFALRLSGVGDSIYGDEVFTYDDVVHRTLPTVVDRVRQFEDTPPLFFLLAWVAAKVGDPAVWIRVPSLILGTALVPLGYMLGARTIGRLGALIGALLIALSPFAVRFASEGRAYSTLAFLVLLSTLALVRALEERGRFRWWALFCLATIAGLYTHYTAFFAIAGQAAWAFSFHRRHWRSLALAYGLVAAAVAPWMVTRPEGHAPLFVVLYPFSVQHALEFWAQSLLGTPQIGVADEPGAAGWWLLGGAAVVAITGLVSARPRIRWPSPGLALIAAMALATPVGVVIYSLVSSSVISGRNMFASAPFALVLVGAALAGLERLRLAIATAAVAATLILGLAIAAQPRWQRPPWKDAADYINHTARPGEAAVELNLFGATAGGERNSSVYDLSLYLDRRVPRSVLFVGDRAAFACLASRPRIYVALESLVGGLAPKPPRLGPRLRLTGRRVFEGFQDIGVFTYQPAHRQAGRPSLTRRGERDLIVQPGQSPRPVRQQAGRGFLEAVTGGGLELTVSGWAVDAATHRPARRILVFDGSCLVGAGRPSVRRNDVARDYGLRATQSGFSFTALNSQAETLARAPRLRIVAVSGKRAWELARLRTSR